MDNLMESDFENASNVMPKHVSHERVGIFAVAHVEGQRYILDDLQVVEEK